MGDPGLSPNYSHNVGLDLTFSSGAGMIRISPYYWIATHNWDQYKSVDSTGAATTRWTNGSSIKKVGTTVSITVKQRKVLGGGVTFAVHDESHDASNLSSGLRRNSVAWSADGNVLAKVGPAYDVQAAVRYRARQTLAQGEVSGVLFTNFGIRYKRGERLWVRLGISDPFGLWRYTYDLAGPNFSQHSINRGTTRRYGLTCGWSWGGKPAQMNERREDNRGQSEGTLPVR